MSDDLTIESGSSGLVARAKAILMQPRAEWPRIAGETTEPMFPGTVILISHDRALLGGALAERRHDFFVKLAARLAARQVARLFGQKAFQIVALTGQLLTRAL